MTKVLLVGAAPSTHQALAWVCSCTSFDAVYAVDGGYATLRDRPGMVRGSAMSWGSIPEQVFGDFDSLGHVPPEAAAVFETHKDFTDMQWALRHALDEGHDEVVMCDALEGRLDHTIGNLSLMVDAARHGLKVWGVTPDQIVVALVGSDCTAQGSTNRCRIAFDEHTAGTISVCAQGEGVVVSETGLEWELDHQSLPNTAPLGVSNQFTGVPAIVEVHSGCAWVFFDHEAWEHVSQY